MRNELQLITAAAEVRTGAGRRRLAAAVTAGRLARIRVGVYVDAAAYAGLGPDERHVVAMRAFAVSRRSTPLFSHRSAAIAHGLPLLERPSKVEVTGAGADARHLVGVRRFGGAVDPARDVVMVRGMAVTTIERTAVDLARAASFEEAVVVLDAAMARVGRSRVEAAAGRSDARIGGTRFERALAFADERSESPGESVSRVSMHTCGLPAPVLQYEFFDRWGFVARGDFWFPQFRVLGEMDGRAKYFDASMSRGDPAAVVYREKQREDRIRALGVRVVRWDWSTARDPQRLGALLMSAGVVPLAREARFGR